MKYVKQLSGLSLILFSTCLVIGCTARPDSYEVSHSTIQHEVKPYRFNFVAWELETLSGLVADKFSGQGSNTAENVLRNQIETVLRENSIPIFPPLRFSLEEPPHLLVISPRNRIVYLDRVLLRQELSEDEMRRIEDQVDKLDVSSLVVELGGFGATYPPIVTNNAGITFLIDAAVEEWLHQYLAFKPLGFRYLLDSIGIQQPPDVIILNETLAGMVSREIGDEVYAKYYKKNEPITGYSEEQGFDFEAEMRGTRKKADSYLSLGDIEAAEQYMEARRKVFVAQGYNIRKINQAYFAFHGIYGDDPASVSPIYIGLTQLRDTSPSLKDFLETTSMMTGYSDLEEALEK
jgi:hypothetical protein